MSSGLVLINHVFLWMSKGIYWLAEKAYDLLMDIANVEIFDSETISGFGERIYVILGIVMLFKLSFSFISYIVNPDAFSSSDKGVGKLVKNMIVVLLLIILTPFIFTKAMELQRLVLNKNIIPNLILGMGSQGKDTINYGDEGEKMSFLVFTSFFKPNSVIYADSDDTKACMNNLFSIGSDDGDGGLHYNEDGVLEMNTVCAEPLDNATGTSYDKNISQVLSLAYQYSNINMLTDTDIIKAKSTVGSEKVATFDFMGITCILAGGFMAWIFIIFCFDIAVRTVKLIFLQLVAPIPIISYVDPKGQNGMFKKWVNTCVKTYLDLFIRLAAIFFAIFIISRLSEAHIYINDGDGGAINNSLVFVFIIFGVLLFVKQLPKLIEDIIGVKLDGSFTLSPGKKLASVPGVAKTLGTVGGVYAGAKFGKESGHALRGAMGGLLTGPKGVSEKDGFLGSFTKGANNASKGIFGKDFKTWSAYDALPGKKRAEDEMKALKDKRNAASNASDIFRAQAQKAAQAGDQETATELFEKAAKYKSVADTYNDQISSIKTQFRIDESNKVGLKKADKTMMDLEKDIEDAKKKYNNNSDDNNNNNNSNNNISNNNNNNNNSNNNNSNNNSNNNNSNSNNNNNNNTTGGSNGGSNGGPHGAL